MYGNGAGIGQEAIHPTPKRIPRDPLQARTASFGAAVGASTRTTAGLPIGTTSVRPSAPTTWDSVSALVLNDSLKRRKRQTDEKTKRPATKRSE
jgi:hypothetical protein